MYQATAFLICGYARAGKDTLAEAIAGRLGNTDKYSFADPLKSSANIAFATLGHPQVDFKSEHWKVKHRKVLVSIAEAAREEDPETFARLGAQRAKESVLINSRNITIPDWRYANEYAEIEKTIGRHKIITIHIKREGVNPANQSEAESMDLIFKSCTMDWVKEFKDGDFDGIDEFAGLLASTVGR